MLSISGDKDAPLLTPGRGRAPLTWRCGLFQWDTLSISRCWFGGSMSETPSVIMWACKHYHPPLTSIVIYWLYLFFIHNFPGLMEPQSQPQGMWSLAPWVHSWVTAHISTSRLQLPCSEGLPHTFPLGSPHFSTSRPSAVRFFSIIERGLGDKRELLGERQTLDLYHTPRVVQTLFVICKGEENTENQKVPERKGSDKKGGEGSALCPSIQT